MADIASRSRGATIGLLYDLHHIVRSVLHQIREEHRIACYDQETFTSHEPSIRPPTSSTTIRMQPIQGRGRDRELIGEVVVEMVSEVVVKMVREVVVHLSRHYLLPYPHPPTYPSPDTCILPHTYTSPDILLPPQTYTPPSILSHTYTSLPSLV